MTKAQTANAILTAVQHIHSSPLSQLIPNRRYIGESPLLVEFGEYAKEHGAKSIEHLPNHLTDFANYWELTKSLLQERRSPKDSE